MSKPVDITVAGFPADNPDRKLVEEIVGIVNDFGGVDDILARLSGLSWIDVTFGVEPLITLLCRNGYGAVAQKMIELGADTRVVDQSGMGILHHACLRSQSGLVSALINAGCDVSVVDGNGLQPLHVASGQFNKRIVSLLIEAGADVNARCSKQKTPLHYCAESSVSHQILEILLKGGADPLAIAADGETPLQKCKYIKGFWKVRSRLRKAEPRARVQSFLKKPLMSP